MLIICEDCAKRYNIDESRIKGNRARFSCKECGHIIIVEKTDLTRPLISRSSAPPGMSASIDLFREMEETPSSDFFSDTASAPEREGGKLEQEVSAAKKSAPIVAYFALAFAAAFLCTSGVLAYLYMADIAPVFRQSQAQSGFLVKSLSMLAVTWSIVFAVFYLLARVLARPINSLKDNIVRRVMGEEVEDDSPCGPREVKELAGILFRITGTRQ